MLPFNSYYSTILIAFRQSRGCKGVEITERVFWKNTIIKRISHKAHKQTVWQVPLLVIFMDCPIIAKLQLNEINFDTGIYTEVIKQQTAQAFEHISKTIDTERRNLEWVLQISPVGGKRISGSEFSNQIPSIKLIEKLPPLDDQSDPLLFRDQIQKLAIRGLSAQKISEKLKMPIGEVEVIMNLTSGDHWNN